jgi:hypothetical protein
MTDVLFFLLLSLVAGSRPAQTGNAEKAALIAVGAVLVWLASRVRRIDATVHQSCQRVGDGGRGHSRLRPERSSGIVAG